MSMAGVGPKTRCDLASRTSDATSIFWLELLSIHETSGLPIVLPILTMPDTVLTASIVRLGKAFLHRSGKFNDQIYRRQGAAYEVKDTWMVARYMISQQLPAYTEYPWKCQSAALPCLRPADSTIRMLHEVNCYLSAEPCQ